MKTNMQDRVFDLLQQLEQAKISCKLARNRDDAITIEAAVPGQRWEIDCLADGTVDVEVFKSDGVIRDESAIERLLREFSD